MGGWLSKVFKKVKTDVRILMVGLDNAGKTTILHQLNLKKYVETEPTMGFNIEHVDYKNIHFSVWDVGGQDKIRPLWRHYFQNCQALVFVVDCNDKARVEEAAEELEKLLRDEELEGAKLLVFANKQDLPNVMTTEETKQRLGLTDVRNREWFIQGCCAKSGEGLFEGLDWVADSLIGK